MMTRTDRLDGGPADYKIPTGDFVRPATAPMPVPRQFPVAGNIPDGSGTCDDHATQDTAAWQTIAWREGTADWLSSRFARRRVRPAHRDNLLSEVRAEEWLLIEWPEDETEPAKYWFSTLSHPVSELYAVGVPSRPRSFAGGRLDRLDFDLNTIAMTTALAGRCPAWRRAGRRYA
jgi:hypothetical protein